MGICRDKATTYLKHDGYNVVRHPQAGIEPLQLIGRQGNAVALLGGLDRLIVRSLGSSPEPDRDHRASDLSGLVSSKLSLRRHLPRGGTARAGPPRHASAQR